MSNVGVKESESLFENPIYVKEVRPRESVFPERHINIPPIAAPPKEFSPEYYEWFYKYVDFSVHRSNFLLAKELANKIWEAFKNNNLEKACMIFEKELLPLKVVPFKERPLKEKWGHMMVQLPGDIGGPNKSKIKAILSERCHGNILEAMCGFNSYLSPSDKRTVTAIDFCREALELYKYPERTRILFDLNEISCKKRMGFFKDETFDFITICFGFQYLAHPSFVFKEFKRLLKPGGKLYLVENPRQHYEDMALRPFSVKLCLSYLEKASFKVTSEELPVAEKWETDNGREGRYYLVEAIKS